jgi:3-oxoacyl-[acyl-carrier protein] reductase
VELGIDGRVALVCAASRGIGFGIARALAADGARVAITSRSRERVDAAAAELGACGYVHDTSDLDAVDRLFSAIEADLGPVDILVTNTGGPPARPDPLGFTREQWEAAHRELTLGPIAMIERALPAMRERGFGRILNVSSSVIYEPVGPLMLSTAHRTGMLGAFKLIAAECAADGVTVNTIVPGRIATARLADTQGSLDAAEAVARETVPARRLGTIDEMGAVGAFLCSAPASYVTGTAVLVDGGLTRGLF